MVIFVTFSSTSDDAFGEDRLAQTKSHFEYGCFSHWFSFFGWHLPRFRKVDSIPNRFVSLVTHFSSPNGAPLFADFLNASNSPLVSAALTRFFHPGGRRIGHAERSRGSGSGLLTQRNSEPQRQSSARSTKFARSAFRSTITANRKKGIVVLNRKALETPLVDVSFTRRVVMGVIAHRMSGRYPSHKTAHLTVDPRANQQVPVIWH